MIKRLIEERVLNALAKKKGDHFFNNSKMLDYFT